MDERRYDDCILAAQSLLRARFWLHLWHRQILHLSTVLPDSYSVALSFISPVSFHILIRLCDTLGFCIPSLVLNHSISASGSSELDFVNFSLGGHRTTIILQFLIRESSSIRFNTSWPGNAHSRLAYREELHKIKTVKISEKKNLNERTSETYQSPAHTEQIVLITPLVTPQLQNQTANVPTP